MGIYYQKSVCIVKCKEANNSIVKIEDYFKTVYLYCLISPMRYSIT